MSRLARENRRKSLLLLKGRSDTFAIRGWCMSSGAVCRLCQEKVRDLYSLSKATSPNGETFVVRTHTDISVCLRCSSVHGDLFKLTGVVAADMPLRDFLDAALAHSVLKT